MAQIWSLKSLKRYYYSVWVNSVSSLQKGCALENQVDHFASYFAFYNGGKNNQKGKYNFALFGFLG